MSLEQLIEALQLIQSQRGNIPVEIKWNACGGHYNCGDEDQAIEDVYLSINRGEYTLKISAKW